MYCWINWQCQIYFERNYLFHFGYLTYLAQIRARFLLYDFPVTNSDWCLRHLFPLPDGKEKSRAFIEIQKCLFPTHNLLLSAISNMKREEGISLSWRLHLQCNEHWTCNILRQLSTQVIVSKISETYEEIISMRKFL